MCGRYGTDNNVNNWIKRHCRHSSENFMRLGDIRPGETAPVIVAGISALTVASMAGGLKSSKG